MEKKGKEKKRFNVVTKPKKNPGRGSSLDRLGAKKSRGEAERMECGLVKIKEEEEEATGPHNIAGMMWG